VAKKLIEEGNEIIYPRNIQEVHDSLETKPDLIISDINDINIEELKKQKFNIIGVPKAVYNLTVNRNIIGELLKHSNIQMFPEGETCPKRLLIEMWFSNGIPLYPANQTAVFTSEVDGNAIAKFILMNYDIKEPYFVQVIFKRLFILFEKIKYSGPFTAVVTYNKDKKSSQYLNSYAGINYGYNYSHILKYIELLECSFTDFLVNNVIKGDTKIPVNINEYIYTLKSVLDISEKGTKIKDTKISIKDKVKKFADFI